MIHCLFEWRIGKHRRTKKGNDLIIDLDYQVDMENGKREREQRIDSDMDRENEENGSE